MNKCEFMGRLGRDPEITTIKSGTKVAKFSVACDKIYIDQSKQRQKKTTWVNCVAWKAKADFAEKWLKKGNRVLVFAEYDTRSWDADDGTKRHAHEFVVQEFHPIDWPDNNQQSQSSYTQDKPMNQQSQSSYAQDKPMNQGGPQPPPEDDLPF